MALRLVVFAPLTSSTVCSPARVPPSTSAIVVSPISGLHIKPLCSFLTNLDGVGVLTEERFASVVRAFSDSGYLEGVESDSEIVDDDDEDEDLMFSNLPLDSKLQLKLEQKLRMKFSKKIRLRRKKLLHKRRMRKRGQWPPSKVNRLKNV